MKFLTPAILALAIVAGGCSREFSFTISRQPRTSVSETLAKSSRFQDVQLTNARRVVQEMNRTFHQVTDSEVTAIHRLNPSGPAGREIWTVRLPDKSTTDHYLLRSDGLKVHGIRLVDGRTAQRELSPAELKEALALVGLAP